MAWIESVTDIGMKQSRDGQIGRGGEEEGHKHNPVHIWNKAYVLKLKC